MNTVTFYPKEKHLEHLKMANIRLFNLKNEYFFSLTPNLNVII